MKNDQSMESKIIVEVILKSAVKFFDQMAHKNYLFTFGKFPIKKLWNMCIPTFKSTPKEKGNVAEDFFIKQLIL